MVYPSVRRQRGSAPPLPETAFRIEPSSSLYHNRLWRNVTESFDGKNGRVPGEAGSWYGLDGVADVLERYHWNTQRHRPHPPDAVSNTCKPQVGSITYFALFTCRSLINWCSRVPPAPGFKVFFMNFLINSGGMFGCLLFTFAHVRLSITSDYSDDKLLEMIQEVQVSL